MRQFTNSELVDWRRCRRRWYIKHYLKLAPRLEHISEARETGNVVHDVVAQGYETNWESDIKADVAYACIALEENLGHDCPEVCIPTIRKIEELATIMVEGYVEWLAEEGSDQDLRLVSTEEIVTVPFQNGVELIGKLDARFFRESDGQTLFMDHKTVGNLTDYPKWLHIDTQFKHYSLLERAAYPDRVTDGGILNMLRKVKRTSRAKPPFYGREEIRYNDHELRSYWYVTQRTVADILEMEGKVGSVAADWKVACYPSPTKDCTWDCNFFQGCALTDDGSDIEDFIKTAYIEINPLERYVRV